MINCKHYKPPFKACNYHVVTIHNCPFNDNYSAGTFCKYFSIPEEIPDIDMPTARYIMKRIRGTQYSKDLEDHVQWMKDHPDAPLTLSDSIWYRGLREGKESACELIETIMVHGK